ncbi:MAG: VOC family protein [Bryobacteraceae bacterium]
MRGILRPGVQLGTGVALSLPLERDFLPLTGVDHVELYVGNAKQAAYFYRAALGFRLAAYRGLETGSRDRVSYVLEQGRIRLVLTSPLGSFNEVAGHVLRHGDGVRAIALGVDDAESAWRETTQRGAVSVQPPTVLRDAAGRVKVASIAAYGDVIHTFVERGEYGGTFLPEFEPVTEPDAVARPVGLLNIDHMVGNVGWGEMNHWVEFYEKVMGFRLYQHFDDHDISTEYSALMSKVMAGGNGRVKFPINEPAQGRRKSQIEEYLEFNGGPGVQHIAMTTVEHHRNGDAAEGTRHRVPDRACGLLRGSAAPRGSDFRTRRQPGRTRDPGGSR